MNIYILCVKNTFASCVFLGYVAIITINCKHFFNIIVSIVKSTIFEVNLP